MKKLKIGKMTSREIAEWMGIAYNYYKNNRKEKLELLKNFAEFEEIYGGVIIKEIYTEVYIKNLQTYDQIYTLMATENSNNLASIAGMIRKLKLLYPNQYEDISDSGLRYQLSKAGERTFGVTANDDSSGFCGNREYIWAVKVSDLNEYRFRTPEEDKIYKELCDKYLENYDAIKIAEKQSLLKAAYDNKEISNNEYAQELIKINKKDDFYKKVIKPFMNQTGEILACTTKHNVIIQQVQRLLALELNN